MNTAAKKNPIDFVTPESLLIAHSLINNNLLSALDLHI